MVVICFQIDYYINNKNMRSCQKSIITKYRITKNIIISTIWVVKYQIYDDDYLFSYMETNWWFTSLLFLVQTKQPKRNNDFILYYTFFIWIYRESFPVVAVFRVVVRLKQIEFVNEIDCNWMVLSLSDFRRNEWMKILMLFILCSHKMILQFAQVL